MKQVVGHKDPIRNPVQKKMEGLFKSNYEKSLKILEIQIAKTIKGK